MALPTKHTMLNKIEGLDTFYNGGKGSGNFGHSGRPGKIGGSGDGSELSSKRSFEADDRKDAKTAESLGKLDGIDWSSTDARRGVDYQIKLLEALGQFREDKGVGLAIKRAAKRGWAYSDDDIRTLVEQYKKGSLYRKAMITAELTDANFHDVVSALIRKDYKPRTIEEYRRDYF